MSWRLEPEAPGAARRQLQPAARPLWLARVTWASAWARTATTAYIAAGATPAAQPATATSHMLIGFILSHSI